MRHQFAALFLASAIGCQPERSTVERSHSGTIDAQDLAGCWVISEDSLKEVTRLGYRKYTNKMDHLIRLNEDGTCVYRTFDAFTIHWFGRSEEELYDSFAGEGERLWPNGIPEARSWYVWDPQHSPFVHGPYSSTNDVPSEGGRWMKNRWNRWRLADGKKTGKRFEDPFETKYRYEVCFDNIHFGSNLFALVGSDHDQLFLWFPAIDRGNGGWSVYDARITKMVRFERLKDPSH